MKRWIKWTGAVVAVLVVLGAAAGGLGYQMAERKMTRKIELAVRPVAYAADAQGAERGKYLFESRGCADCHGATGGGREFVNDGKGLRLAGPNITVGGATALYRPEDWVRAIRHGIKPAGRPIMIMPSEDYNRFTDHDLGALVAYVRNLPPRQGGAAVLELPVPVRVLYGFGRSRIQRTRSIIRSLPRSRWPKPSTRSTARTWPICASAAMASICPAAGFRAVRPIGRRPRISRRARARP